MLLSFRDPAGSLEDDGQRIWRTVHPGFTPAVQDLLASQLFADLIKAGLLIPVINQHLLTDGSLRLEHPRVELPSYPFEWSPAQLIDAGRLTLEIQRRAWQAGYTLKDASAFNVLFVGSRPVFCDLLSLERRREDGNNSWHAYGQFVRHFLLPLIAVREHGRMPRDVFLAHRDGLRALDILPFVRRHRYWGLDFLLHFRIPGWLETRRAGATPESRQHQRHTSRAHDSTPWLISSLDRTLSRLDRKGQVRSSWSNYVGNRAHYEAEALERKRTLIADLLASLAPERVLDIGANTGEYSLLAVAVGAKVLAIDEDAQALDTLHRQAREQGLPLQTLHTNFARPTPPTGWRLRETRPLSYRLQGRFDVVLMLAVIHHLAITERLPITQIFDEVSTLCRGHLILEFVAREDPRFVELAGPNQELFATWSKQALIDAARSHFTLEAEYEVSPSRHLLLLRKA